VELILPTVDADTGTVSEVWDKLGFRETVGRAAQQRVWLKDQDLPGAHLVIQQTEALTAVDVNAGRAAFGLEGTVETVAVAVNVAAAVEVAAQLRLRDVGGLVMIDFIDMQRRKNRRAVELAFLESARADLSQTPRSASVIYRSW
jgi:Rne/Rng family ribonuclease